MSLDDFAVIPDFDEVASFIAVQFDALRVPYMQWTNLARLAIQGLPYDADRLATLGTCINERRAELRRVIVVASEHFTGEQLDRLRDQARMSKYAWRSLKKNQPITIKNGFTLISY